MKNLLIIIALLPVFPFTISILSKRHTGAFAPILEYHKNRTQVLKSYNHRFRS